MLVVWWDLITCSSYGIAPSRMELPQQAGLFARHPFRAAGWKNTPFLQFLLNLFSLASVRIVLI